MFSLLSVKSDEMDELEWDRCTAIAGVSDPHLPANPTLNFKF
jgi:hypothetical protein